MKQLKISKSITNRESNSIEKYLAEISKEPLITADEEIQLAKRIRDGDEEAAQKLVRANLRFVVSVAKQYLTVRMQLNDLINEGNVGLVKAAKKFDETRGFRFISYAVWWIRQSILQALAENQRMVRVPLNRIETEQKMYHAEQKFMAEYEREPTDEELAEVMDFKIEDITVARSITHAGYVSFDAATASAETGELMSVSYDTVPDRTTKSPDATVVDVDSRSQDIFTVLKTLPKNEAEVIIKYFGLGGGQPMSLEDVAQSMRTPITSERARQIRDNGLQRIRYKSAAIKKLRVHLS